MMPCEQTGAGGWGGGGGLLPEGFPEEVMIDLRAEGPERYSGGWRGGVGVGG